MLAIHLTSAIGWTGAAAAYLVLVFIVLTNPDTRTVVDAKLVMELTVWFVIVPLAYLAFLTGLVISLGTPWGLFRYFWVLFSFLLTLFAIYILTEYSISAIDAAALAAKPDLSSADLHLLRDPGDAVHDIGGILLLLSVTVLNIYKPRGLTRYGWRKQREAKVARLARAG